MPHARAPLSSLVLLPADECLLLGTSEGCLQLHSAASGALLLRQRLHHSGAVGAAVRWAGAGSDPEDLSEDVTLCECCCLMAQSSGLPLLERQGAR